jgi:hypothetical protein
MDADAIVLPVTMVRFKALLMLPADASPDLSMFSNPVRIPVHLVWCQQVTTPASVAPSS